jgi:hypothetical protein
VNYKGKLKLSCWPALNRIPSELQYLLTEKMHLWFLPIVITRIISLIKLKLNGIF